MLTRKSYNTVNILRYTCPRIYRTHIMTSGLTIDNIRSIKCSIQSSIDITQKVTSVPVLSSIDLIFVITRYAINSKFLKVHMLVLVFVIKCHLSLLIVILLANISNFIFRYKIQFQYGFSDKIVRRNNLMHGVIMASVFWSIGAENIVAHIFECYVEPMCSSRPGFELSPLVYLGLT